MRANQLVLSELAFADALGRGLVQVEGDASKASCSPSSTTSR